MRKALPQDEYRLIKNRKSARICRRKRKLERGTMQEDIKTLRQANDQYSLQVTMLRQELEQIKK